MSNYIGNSVDLSYHYNSRKSEIPRVTGVWRRPISSWQDDRRRRRVLYRPIALRWYLPESLFPSGHHSSSRNVLNFQTITFFHWMILFVLTISYTDPYTNPKSHFVTWSSSMAVPQRFSGQVPMCLPHRSSSNGCQIRRTVFAIQQLQPRVATEIIINYVIM